MQTENIQSSMAEQFARIEQQEQQRKEQLRRINEVPSMRRIQNPNN